MYELITDRQNNRCTLKITEGLGVERLKALHSFLENCKWEIVQVERLSLEQSKLIWVLCSELGDLIGYTREEMRDILQNQFCEEKDMLWFSISPFKSNAATKEIASEFTQFIIEWSLNNDYNIQIPEGKGQERKLKSIRTVVPDIRRYVIACMLSKTCSVCGRKETIALHHIPSVASIGGYEHCNGLKTGFLPLCGVCHSKAHTLGDKEFKNLYHIEEVWLTENLVSELKSKYNGYFKAFRRDK